MMNIGLITGEYPPMQGGVGDYTRELARALMDLGHAVTVITSAQLADRVNDASIRVEPIAPNWSWRCWRAIADAARRLDLDVLNIQYEPAAYAMRVGINFFPGWYARQSRRIPVVTTFHDLLVPYLFPKAGRLRWKVVEHLARRSEAVIVTNEEDRLKMIADRRRPTAVLQPQMSNLQLIPIGSNIHAVALENFDREAERTRWDADQADWLIGYFGFLSMSKGGRTLMQALAMLIEQGHPARLLLIGGRSGSSDPENVRYAAEVDAAIASLAIGDRVRRTGFLEPAQVTAALRAVDVMALPYADGLSFRRGSLMAALAHGKAIVSTHPSVALPEVIGGQNCLLVERENAKALADGIHRVMCEPQLRARLENGASELSQLFTWDKIAEQTVEVFRGVLR
jgi:glycosyltransferase involved in cell wall biosynthesis